MKRRTFLKNTSLTAGALSLGMYSGCRNAATEEGRQQAVAITAGEKQHWFGYYDKWQVDPSGRYALGCQVDAFFRSPTPDDTLRVGLIDLENDNAWKEIGTSTAWGWQQSCMLQWIPGSDREVIWNDHGPEGFISRIYNIKTGETRTLPRAIYTLSPDGSFALCVDFDRLQFFRPGYGYPAKQPAESWPKAPADAGIYKMDLQTGAAQMIVSYAQIAPLPRQRGSVEDNFHWFNHLLINPSGTRFIFLNRSRPVASPEEMAAYRKEHQEELKRLGYDGSWITRAITADTDGSDLYPLNDSGHFSHFIWKGNDAICAWASPNDLDKDAFYVFPDKRNAYEQVGEGVMVRNGHNTYVPNTNYEWILNDTYPVGEQRLQELYLFHVPSGRKVTLGQFQEPEQFTGEWRCDLHPRCDQQGKRVFFDSSHDGGKRQIYMADISDIVN